MIFLTKLPDFWLYSGDRILHIVAGCDTINIYIITAYYPDTQKFEADLKTRRKG